jgi:sortase A
LRSRILRILEISTLVAGLALVAFFVAARLDSYFASRAAVANFEASIAQPQPRAEAAPAGKSAPEPAATTAKSVEPATPLAAPAKVDFSLWSAGRVRAYRASLKQNPGRPVALLRIPKIHLVVPVFEGTDELTLNRGVGRIQGTAFPGQPGNLGIAGHRDGFFRGLKNVSRGDVLELVDPRETATYVIDKIEIVTPKDVSVLQPGPSPQITLVTCYPFYYVGHAPKRFIVTGSLEKVASNTGQRSDRKRKDALQGEKRQ